MACLDITGIFEVRRLRSVILSLGTMAIVFITTSIDAEVELRHPHDGILAPYPSAPPQAELKKAERVKLEHDEAVFTWIKTATGERPAIVFRVGAPRNIVWSVITDYSSYPEWIDGLAETEVYRRQDRKIFVRFRSEQTLMGSLTYYVQHRLSPVNDSWITWQLDYQRKSDLDDTVGFWRISTVPEDSLSSDVTYSTDVRLKGWFASLFSRRLVNNTLRRASAWVKTQSELRVAAIAGNPPRIRE